MTIAHHDTNATIEALNAATILPEHCWTHDGPDNGGWTCQECHHEQGTGHLLDMQDIRRAVRAGEPLTDATMTALCEQMNHMAREHTLGQRLASQGFLEGMVALGYIEDTGDVIADFLDGLVSEAEAMRSEVIA